MTEHNPEFETKITFSDIEKKTDYICQYIRRRVPDIDIAIANHLFDESIPDGITFILPKGAVEIDPNTAPLIYQYENGKMKISYAPKLLFRMPDLVFKIDENGVVTGMSSFAQEFANKLNEATL